jgi:alpha-glucosidase
MVQALKEQGIRVMVYMSSFLVDVDGQTGFGRNLYREARNLGYLLKKQSGDIYHIRNTTFDAGLMDWSNPSAVAWFKQVIKDEVLGVGASGWMADYSEAQPFDCVLHSGADPAAFHNEYAERWAQLNREAIEEEGLQGEAAFFTRAGFTQSPKFSTLFFLGDQMVTWDQYDGIKSAVVGMISGGLSGISLNHSDIGGYTNVSLGILNFHREKELLLRWMELSAFSPVFRTHEGLQPQNNAQIYSDRETHEHFSRFAKVYRALAFYRTHLMKEAEEKGYPLVRNMFLHYPNDPVAYEVKYQWMLGSDFVVAPILDKKTTAATVYLPAGKWVHVWSGEEFGREDQGAYYHIADAPIGRPPVFFKKGSPFGEIFLENLAGQNL